VKTAGQPLSPRRGVDRAYSSQTPLLMKHEKHRHRESDEADEPRREAIGFEG
jgi:hypothetical protein